MTKGARSTTRAGDYDTGSSIRHRPAVKTLVDTGPSPPQLPVEDAPYEPPASSSYDQSQAYKPPTPSYRPEPSYKPPAPAYKPPTTPVLTSRRNAATEPPTPSYKAAPSPGVVAHQRQATRNLPTSQDSLRVTPRADPDKHRTRSWGTAGAWKFTPCLYRMQGDKEIG
nr:extensin-like [Penaeus vannamei]